MAQKEGGLRVPSKVFLKDFHGEGEQMCEVVVLSAPHPPRTLGLLSS